MLALVGAWAVLAIGGEICAAGATGEEKPGCATGFCWAVPGCCEFWLGVGGISLICEEAGELRASTPRKQKIGHRTAR